MYVQMPGKDGFAVLEEISRQYVPLVIFVIALDLHALRAFDGNWPFANTDNSSDSRLSKRASVVAFLARTSRPV